MIGNLRHVFCLCDQLVGHQMAHQTVDTDAVLDGGKAPVENGLVYVDSPAFLPQLPEISFCSAQNRTVRGTRPFMLHKEASRSIQIYTTA